MAVMTRKYQVKDNKDKETFLNICEDAINGNTARWDIIYKVRNTLYGIDMGGRQFVLKCFAVPSVFKRIYYSVLCKSKAFRAYFNGLKILQKGGYTANVIGYLEVVKWGLLEKSFFLTENLSEYSEIRKQMKGIDLTDAFSDALISFIADMHRNGIYHKDMSPGNILYREKDLDFKIVDINRMSFFDGELDFETSALSFYRLSDGKTEILSELSGKYAVARGFDPDLFVSCVSDYADRFFMKKMYKWSVTRPEKPHVNKLAYTANLLFFIFVRKIRHILGENMISSKIKNYESAFYFRHLQYNDVRGVMIRKEGYKTETV